MVPVAGCWSRRSVAGARPCDRGTKWEEGCGWGSAQLVVAQVAPNAFQGASADRLVLSAHLHSALELAQPRRIVLPLVADTNRRERVRGDISLVSRRRLVPLLGVEGTSEHLHERGLPTAVLAEEADDLRSCGRWVPG